MNQKIPSLASPNSRELNRMVKELERRVMIIGRDQRTYSGIFDLRARAYFVVGFVLAIILVVIGWAKW